MTNFHGFVWEYFYFPVIPKEYFAVYRSLENSKCFFYYMQGVAFLSFFHNFFSVFSFQKCNYVLTWLSLCLHDLWFNHLESVGLYLLPNFEKFWLLFLWIIFQPHLFFSHFKTLVTWMSDLFIQSHIFKGFLLLCFFGPFFSLLFIPSNLYCSIFEFADSFLCCLHYDVELIHSEWAFLGHSIFLF